MEMLLHRLIFSCSNKPYKNDFLFPLCNAYISKIKKTCIFNWRTESFWHFRYPNKNICNIYLFILTNDNTTLRCYWCCRVPHYNVYLLFFPEAGQGSSWPEGLHNKRDQDRECDGSRNTCPLDRYHNQEQGIQNIFSPGKNSRFFLYLLKSPKWERFWENLLLKSFECVLKVLKHLLSSFWKYNIGAKR